MNKKVFIIISILFFILILFLITNYNNKQENPSNWSVNRDEYPLEEYSLDKLPVSHKSSIEVRKFFEESDTNHDGLLKGEEINTFDYKIKHSQTNYNGPYGYN